MTGSCVVETKQSNIKVGENGRQAIIKNPGNELFCKAKVDGCLLKNKTSSDYVVSKPNVGDVVIELKGCDVDHAVEQVKSTMDFWKQNGLSNGLISALVVCTKYPKIDTKIQRAKLALAKIHKSPLHIVTQNLEYDFDALLSFRGPHKA